ncbi:MAG: HAD-IA family hydrolase [Candidatus Bathyarchaeia archaeon]
MKLKAKGIIMDLDGTLVDSREAYCEALKKAFAAMGLENFSVEIALEIPRRLEQNLPINDLIPKCNVNNFLDIYLKTYYSLTESKAKPFPGVSKTLEELSKGAKLALVTMRYVSKEKVRKELENLGLAKYFHSILTALDTPSPKPSPEALIKCAQQLGVKMEECVSVGDSVVDVRAGKRSGARTVAVLTGIFVREELEKENPDLIIQTISELPSFISF